MASETTGQLCLAQNQYAFIQDATKGTVAVYAGAYSFSLSGNDRPVLYDKDRDTFIQVNLSQAISQNPLVPEGHYLVLENPKTDSKGELHTPTPGNNSPEKLSVGRKITIPGPVSFPLWPGQVAQAIPGHHLRSNQYLVVRVYNSHEAENNATDYLKKSGSDGKFTPGQLLVIKGTESSFFIPPTGFEVLKENNSYVREALTLERLEYCILLDEDGNKRYEMGPQVVFPEATERFLTKDGSTRKFKTIELNDQMGLYAKVIADYDTEGSVKVPEGAKDGDEFSHNNAKYRVQSVEVEGKAELRVFAKTGEELFITGKEQRIYYPRAEHALIGYDDPKTGYKRERYYGITIPKGEGRYVLDKAAGDIKKVEGPQIFLPDPRNEVIVRRVLDDKTVGLWYPQNTEALTFNKSLRALNEDASSNYLAETTVLAAAADATRSLNRGLTKSKAFSEPVGSSYEGDRYSRGTKFTPPPMLTLNNKYDGVPSISVWTGYAVQVVNKSGNRRVVVGPDTVLLEYDETLEMLELSTGKPKNTDSLKRDVYLRIDNNLVSDVVRIETLDLVNVDLKLSYRVNFLREHKEKWFSIENYVKYLCDHMRSLLKASFKKASVKEVMENSAVLIRDVVLGKKNGEENRHRMFIENGMDVYDVEVLSVTITDSRIADLLKNAQTKAVETAITLASDEQTLVNTRRKSEIDREIAKLNTEVSVYKQEMAMQVAKAEAEVSMAKIEAEIAEEVAHLNAAVREQEQRNQVAAAEFQRFKTNSDYEMEMEKERVALFEKKMAALVPDLIQAMQTLGDTETVTRLAEAIAPLAIMEQTSTGVIMERLFKGTPLDTILKNAKNRTKSATASE